MVAQALHEFCTQFSRHLHGGAITAARRTDIMAGMEKGNTMTQAKHPRRHNSLFRTLVALEACRPEANLACVAARHDLGARQVAVWKRHLADSTVQWALKSGQEWWF